MKLLQPKTSEKLKLETHSFHELQRVVQYMMMSVAVNISGEGKVLQLTAGAYHSAALTGQ